MDALTPAEQCPELKTWMRNCAKDYVLERSSNNISWQMLSPRGQIESLRQIALLCAVVESQIFREAEERANDAAEALADLKSLRDKE